MPAQASPKPPPGAALFCFELRAARARASDDRSLPPGSQHCTSDGSRVDATGLRARRCDRAAVRSDPHRLPAAAARLRAAASRHRLPGAGLPEQCRAPPAAGRARARRVTRARRARRRVAARRRRALSLPQWQRARSSARRVRGAPARLVTVALLALRGRHAAGGGLLLAVAPQAAGARRNRLAHSLHWPHPACAAQAQDVETQLAELQRKYRILEARRRRCGANASERPADEWHVRAPGHRATARRTAKMRRPSSAGSAPLSRS